MAYGWKHDVDGWRVVTERVHPVVNQAKIWLASSEKLIALNRVQMTKLSTPSVATLLVPSVSGGQFAGAVFTLPTLPLIRGQLLAQCFVTDFPPETGGSTPKGGGGGYHYLPFSFLLIHPLRRYAPRPTCLRGTVTGAMFSYNNPPLMVLN